MRTCVTMFHFRGPLDPSIDALACGKSVRKLTRLSLTFVAKMQNALLRAIDSTCPPPVDFFLQTRPLPPPDSISNAMNPVRSPWLLTLTALACLGACADEAQERPRLLFDLSRPRDAAGVDGAATDMALALDGGGQRSDLSPDVPDVRGALEACEDGVQNGEETGVDCGGTCPGLCAPCATEGKRLFVTSQSYSGNLSEAAREQAGAEATGAQAGDALCTARAWEAGLGGTWRAWLSARDGQDVKGRVEEVGPWHLVDRCTVVAESVASLLLKGPRVQPNRDEFGQLILAPRYWTGTALDGRLELPNCMDWGSKGQARRGLTGDPTSSAEGSWTKDRLSPCTQSFSLLCFEQ